MVVLGKMVIKELAVYGCIGEDGHQRISCVWLYWVRWLLKDQLYMVVLEKIDLKGLVVYGCIGEHVIKGLAVYGCIGEDGP